MNFVPFFVLTGTFSSKHKKHVPNFCLRTSSVTPAVSATLHHDVRRNMASQLFLKKFATADETHRVQY